MGLAASTDTNIRKIHVLPRDNWGQNMPQKLILYDGERPQSRNINSYPKVIKILKPPKALTNDFDNDYRRFQEMQIGSKSQPYLLSSLNHSFQGSQANDRRLILSRYRSNSEGQPFYHMHPNYNQRNIQPFEVVDQRTNSVNSQYFTVVPKAHGSINGEQYGNRGLNTERYGHHFDSNPSSNRSNLSNILYNTDAIDLQHSQHSTYLSENMSNNSVKVSGELQLALVEKYQDRNGTTFRLVRTVPEGAKIVQEGINYSPTGSISTVSPLPGSSFQNLEAENAFVQESYPINTPSAEFEAGSTEMK